MVLLRGIRRYTLSACPYYSQKLSRTASTSIVIKPRRWQRQKAFDAPIRVYTKSSVRGEEFFRNASPTPWHFLAVAGMAVGRAYEGSLRHLSVITGDLCSSELKLDLLGRVTVIEHTHVHIPHTFVPSLSFYPSFFESEPRRGWRNRRRAYITISKA